MIKFDITEESRIDCKSTPASFLACIFLVCGWCVWFLLALLVYRDDIFIWRSVSAETGYRNVDYVVFLVCKFWIFTILIAN